MINKIKVILVEDEPFWQQNISEYIEKEADDIEVISIVDSKEETLKATNTVYEINVLFFRPLGADGEPFSKLYAKNVNKEKQQNANNKLNR